jgi:hypothetical protein
MPGSWELALELLLMVCVAVWPNNDWRGTRKKPDLMASRALWWQARGLGEQNREVLKELIQDVGGGEAKPRLTT